MKDVFLFLCGFGAGCCAYPLYVILFDRYGTDDCQGGGSGVA